jgi:hypothetical protein
VLTDLQLSNSGNVEEVSALALGFVVFATFMETDKYFPNFGSELAACAEAFGSLIDGRSRLPPPHPRGGGLLTRKRGKTIHTATSCRPCRPCRHGYGRVDRLPFSLLPRRQLPS